MRAIVIGMKWHGLPRTSALGLSLAALGCFEESDPVGAETGNGPGTSSDGDTALGTSTPDDDSTGTPTTTTGTTASADDSSGEDGTTAAGGIPSSALIVYPTAPLPGDLAAPAGGAGLVAFVDNQCTLPPPYVEQSCTVARAIIRLPGFEIMNIGLPTGRPVYAPSGDEVAGGVAMFLAGQFSTQPSVAGVLPGMSQFWTGAGEQVEDCDGWTGVGTAAVGDTQQGGIGWLDAGSAMCNQMRPLLCLCWSE